MGEMRVMGEEGDAKSIWDPSNKEECDAIEEMFNDLTDRGFTAYRVKKDGSKSGSKMKTFDKKAGKIIMVPRIVGG